MTPGPLVWRKDREDLSSSSSPPSSLCSFPSAVASMPSSTPSATAAANDDEDDDDDDDEDNEDDEEDDEEEEEDDEEEEEEEEDGGGGGDSSSGNAGRSSFERVMSSWGLSSFGVKTSSGLGCGSGLECGCELRVRGLVQRRFSRLCAPLLVSQAMTSHRSGRPWAVAASALSIGVSPFKLVALTRSAQPA